MRYLIRYINWPAKKAFFLAILFGLVSASSDSILLFALGASVGSVFDLSSSLSADLLIILAVLYFVRTVSSTISNWFSITYVYSSATTLSVIGIKKFLEEAGNLSPVNQAVIYSDPEIAATRFYKGALTLAQSTISIFFLVGSISIFSGFKFFIFVSLLIVIAIPFYWFYSVRVKTFSSRRAEADGRFHRSISQIINSPFDYHYFSDSKSIDLVFGQSIVQKYFYLALYNFFQGNIRLVLEFIFVLALGISLLIFHFVFGIKLPEILSFVASLGYFAARFLPIVATIAQSTGDLSFGKMAIDGLSAARSKRPSIGYDLGLLDAIPADDIFHFEIRRIEDNKSIKLSLLRNDVIIITGGVGVGKTLLLKILTIRLNEIFSANRWRSGYPINSLFAVYVGPIGWVLPGTLSENIFGGKNTAIDKDFLVTHERALKRWFPELDLLWDRVDLSLEKISTGKKQLISVLRGVHSGASVVCLDEPTSSMDSDLEKRLCGFLAEEVNCILVLVTHRDAPKALGTQFIGTEDFEHRSTQTGPSQ